MPVSRWPLVLIAAAAGWPMPTFACTVSASPVAFGVVDMKRDTEGTGVVVVRCETATSFRVGISSGGRGGEDRRMDGPGSHTLRYQLYQDAGHATIWGDDGDIGGARNGSSDGRNPTRLTIYGVIPAEPDTEPGDYQDNLQVTLTF